MEAWTFELENLLLHALLHAWQVQNHRHFRGQMQPPLFALRSAEDKLGEWAPSKRCISMSLPFVRKSSWREVESVLLHEMAHQYVHEILQVHDESPHGEAFRRVCHERQIDARASGHPNASNDLDDEARDTENRVLRRVRKLLALAGSQNWHEADAAARAAQRLMLEHNLALQQGAVNENYFVESLHEPKIRLHAHQKMLGGLIAAHYFVHVIVARVYLPERGKEGFVLEAAGTAENLKMARYVFRFLEGAAQRAFDAAVDEGRILQKSKQRYLTGFVRGVAEKLRVDEQKNDAEGLVWLGDPKLQSFVSRTFGRLSKSRIKATIDDAHLAGKKAGRKVVIHHAVEEPTKARGHLLRGRNP